VPSASTILIDVNGLPIPSPEEARRPSPAWPGLTPPCPPNGLKPSGRSLLETARSPAARCGRPWRFGCRRAPPAGRPPGRWPCRDASSSSLVTTSSPSASAERMNCRTNSGTSSFWSFPSLLPSKRSKTSSTPGGPAPVPGRPDGGRRTSPSCSRWLIVLGSASRL